MTHSVQAAECYISAHQHRQDGTVERFVSNLPEADSLYYRACLCLQKGFIAQANTLFYSLAQLNHPQGYKGLADSYLAGQGGLCLNEELALTLYEKAGRMGVGAAQVNAAVLHAHKQNTHRARQWFRKALGNPALSFMRKEIADIYHQYFPE